MKITAGKILVFGTPLVLTLWVGYGLLSLNRPVTTWGVFGDKFGALSCLFTGLALVGLVAGYWHEREQAAGRDTEHRETMKVMRAQVHAHSRALKLQAMVARAEAIRSRLAGLESTPVRNPFGDDKAVLYGELKNLESKIREESETIWHWGVE